MVLWVTKTKKCRWYYGSLKQRGVDGIMYGSLKQRGVDGIMYGSLKQRGVDGIMGH